MEFIHPAPAATIAMICNSTQMQLLFYQFLQQVQPNVDNNCTQRFKDVWLEKQDDIVQECQQHVSNVTLMHSEQMSSLQKRLEGLQNDHVLALSKYMDQNADLRGELEKYKMKLDEFNGDSFAGKNCSEEVTESTTNVAELQIPSEVLCEKGAAGETSANLNETLIHATSIGNTSLVSKYLECGADPNSAVHLASHFGHSEIVQLLLDRVADIDLERKSDKWTPLHVAVQHGHLNVVRVLLSNGAERDLRRSDGCTPLYQASSSGNVKIVQMLLEYNASLELECENGSTPLHVAVQHGHLNVVRVLLSNGAERDVRRSDGCTPLYQASSSGNVQIVQMLLEYNASLELECENGSTPLHVAIQHGHLNMVRLLLSKGAEPDVRIRSACSSVYADLPLGKSVMTKMLVKHVFIFQMKCENGSTPLHVAAMTNQAKLASLLLEYGADVNGRDANNRTALHLAAGDGNLEIVQLLIKYNANVNLPDRDGWTALHIATLYDHFQMAKALLEAGADSNIPDGESLVTPLYVAIFKNSNKVVRLLIQHNANVDQGNKDGWTPLCAASYFASYSTTSDYFYYNLIEIIRYLLEVGANVNTLCGDLWEAPLHIVTMKGYEELVKLLIQHNANVNLPMKNGRVALYIAVMYNYLKTAEALLDAGADVNVEDADTGFTPLHSAAYNGNLEMVTLLVNKGANVTQCSKLNKATPREFAMDGGHKRVAEYLASVGG